MNDTRILKTQPHNIQTLNSSPKRKRTVVQQGENKKLKKDLARAKFSHNPYSEKNTKAIATLWDNVKDLTGTGDPAKLQKAKVLANKALRAVNGFEQFYLFPWLMFWQVVHDPKEGDLRHLLDFCERNRGYEDVKNVYSTLERLGLVQDAEDQQNSQDTDNQWFMPDKRLNFGL